MTALAQPFDGSRDMVYRVGAKFFLENQRPLIKEMLLADAQGSEILADRNHHLFERDGANDGKPLGLRTILERLAKGLGNQRADRLEIVARIKPFRNDADVFAQGFAITQIGRARERIDLGAGIVDVIFARDLVAGESQEIGQRIAEYRAAAVADMHRPGRVS